MNYKINPITGRLDLVGLLTKDEIIDVLAAGTNTCDFGTHDLAARKLTLTYTTAEDDLTTSQLSSTLTYTGDVTAFGSTLYTNYYALVYNPVVADGGNSLGYGVTGSVVFGGTIGGASSSVGSVGVYGTSSGNMGTTGSTSHAGVIGGASGTADSNYGGSFTATGAATTNYGVYSTASGGTNNYSFYGAAGNFYQESNSQLGNANVLGDPVHGINTAPVANQMLTAYHSCHSDAASYIMKSTQISDGNTEDTGNKDVYGYYLIQNISGEHTGTVPNICDSYGLYLDINDSTLVDGSGVEHNIYGIYLDNTFSGTNSANVGITSYGLRILCGGNLGSTPGSTIHYASYITASGTAQTNYGCLLGASGADINYSLYILNGNVFLGPDNTHVYLGTGFDYDMYQDGNDTKISNSTGTIIYTSKTQFGDSSTDYLGINTAPVQYQMITADFSANYTTAYFLRGTQAATGLYGHAGFDAYGISHTLSMTGQYQDNVTYNDYGLDITATLSASVLNAPTINYYGGRFSNTFAGSVSGGTPTINSFGLDVINSSALGTTGTITKYGERITVTGTADTNYGLYVSASGATANTAIYTSGKVEICGVADEYQFTIRTPPSPVSQSLDIFQITDSAGGQYCSIDYLGTYHPMSGGYETGYSDTRTILYAPSSGSMVISPTYTDTDGGTVHVLELLPVDNRECAATSTFTPIYSNINSAPSCYGNYTSRCIDASFLFTGSMLRTAGNSTSQFAGLYSSVVFNPTIVTATRTHTASVYGQYIILQTTPTVTSGTYVANLSGLSVSIAGTSDGTTTCYGINLSSITGGDTLWGFYNGTSAAHNLLGKDNVKSYFGTGSDLSIYHDGTNSFIENATGKLILTAPTTVEIGNGAAGVDYILSVNGENTDFTFTFDEDEGAVIYTGGYFRIGTGAINNSTDPMIVAVRDLDDTGAGTGVNGHCFSDSTDITRTGTVAYNSFDARVDFEGTANYDHYAGFQFSPTYGSSGTITNMYGFYNTLTINSGTCTNFYGAYVANPTGAGAVTNAYGINIAALTKGATINRAINVANNNSRFRQDGSASETLPITLQNGYASDNSAVGIDFMTSTAQVGKIVCKRNASSNYSLLFTSYGASGLFQAAEMNATGKLITFGNLTIGVGTAGTDYVLTFDGETNDGVITWMEDEDYFQFSDDVLMSTTENIYFRDTAIHISSANDGDLDIEADTSIDLLINGTEQLTLVDGALKPTTDNDIDLGDSTHQFKDLYLAAGSIKIRDAGISIGSSDDGHLDLAADVSIDLNGAVVGSSTASFTTLTATAAGGLTLGTDTAGGGANIPGYIKMFSAGDNAFYSTFTAGTQTANATYTLPVAMPASNMVLQSTSTGVLSWVVNAGGYSLGTAGQIPYVNATNDDLSYSAGLVFDGTNLALGGLIDTYNNVATEGMGVAPIYDYVVFTNKGADVAATNFTNCSTAGLYRISYYLVTTTADGVAAPMLMTIAYTDDEQAQTQTASINLADAGDFASGTFIVQLASGNITYATAAAIYQNARCSIYLTCERLN